MIFGKEIEKLDASIEEIEKALDVFSSEICLGVTSLKQDIGNSVEFIFDGEIVEGVVQRLVSVKRSLVKTSTGLFLVSNNKFLQPVDNDFFQCKNNGEINLAQIKAEFAQAELEEVEAESLSLWEEAIAKEQPELNLATADVSKIDYPFEPSIYQQEILNGLTFRHQQLGGLGSRLQSMVVEALAGCAKSSTMVLIAVFLKHNDYKAAHCRFVVFGKSNQQDLKDKIESATGKPSWGKIVQTLHSFAFEIWRGKDKTKDYKIDDRRDKYQSIAQSLGAITKSGKEGDLDKKNSNGVSVCCEAVDFLELVEKLRIYCVREITPSSVLAIAQRCQMDTFLINQAEKLEKVAYWCQRVLEEGARLAVEEKWIDYTDMLWLLWKEQGRFRKAIDKWRGKLKFIGVDESQDMNLLQIAVLKILHNPQTNFFCFVGDRWQAIYGFRGSESDCMDIVQREFKCDRFYLPLNFRCGKKHLALVRQIFPHIKIEPRSDAPEGVIRYIKESELSGLLMSEREKIPTFGIARRNASLINMAIQLALRGIPVKFKEGLVSKKIYNFVRQAVSCSGQLYQSEKFPQILKHYAEAKIARLPQNNRLIVEWEIRDLEKCCLLLFYQYQIRSLSHWNQVLEMIFEKKEAQIEFHTIHSGKGGEGERVLFVYPDETPLSYPGQTSEERQQEQNAIYIALTRCLARNDRPSGELWLVIREVMEKGKSVLKLPVWLPTSKKSPDNK